MESGSRPKPKKSTATNLYLLLATIIPFALILLQWYLWNYLQPYVWVLLYPAVLLSTWLAGKRAGLFATVITTFGGWYFFLPVPNSFFIDLLASALSIVIFAVVCISFVLTHSRMTAARQKAESAFHYAHSVNLHLEELIDQKADELDRTDEALQETEERLRVLSDHLPDSYVYQYTYHADGSPHFLYVSAGVTRIHGVSPEAVLKNADTLHSQIDPEQFPALIEAEKQSMSNLSDFQMDLRMCGTDNLWRWLRVRSRPWQYPDGQIIWNGVATDITQHKKRETEIKNERDFSATLIDSLPGVFYLYDSNFKFLRWNRNFEKVLGYSCAEIAQKSPLDFFTDPDKQLLADRIQEVFQQGRSEVEADFVSKDGTSTPYFFTGEKLTIANQDCLLGVGIDISERKLAEEKLRVSEEKFNNAFHVSPAGITITRISSGEFIEVNEAFLQIFEFERHEVIGHSSTELNMLVPEERDKLIEAQLKFGGLRNWELKARSKTGRNINILFSSKAVELEGELCHVTTMIDISTRKQAEEALRESEQKFMTLFHSSPTGTALRTFDGYYVDVNSVYCSMLGYTKQGMIGQTSADLGILTEEERDEPTAKFELDDIPKNPHELKLRHRDGSYVDVLFTNAIITLRGVPHQLSTIQDITKRKQVECEIRQLNDTLEQRITERTHKLEKVNRELEAFSYSVSHDLKAPLRGIDGYSRLLEEEYTELLGNEGRLFVNNIRQSAAQMNRLIEDLLSYSRMERRPLQSTSLNLLQIVQGVLAERSDAIEAARAEIHLDVPDIQVVGDREGLAVVLRNLLENALKFSVPSAPPVIEIKAKQETTKAIVQVSDNGIGFDMKFHDRIFEIFNRLQRAEDYPGTGIGLALVRKAMQRMDGKVWAESIPGQGTTFFLEIPI